MRKGSVKKDRKKLVSFMIDPEFLQDFTSAMKEIGITQSEGIRKAMFSFMWRMRAQETPNKRKGENDE